MWKVSIPEISFSISVYMGKQRSGKTLSMVADSYNTLLNIKEYELYLNSKKKLTNIEKKRLNLFSKFELMSNLKLNKNIFGNYIHITADNLLEMYKSKVPIENKIILLDDFFKTVDSRRFASDSNRVYSYFFTEIGKKKNIMKYVSHFDKMVELRLRSMTEYFIWCKKGKFKEINYKENNEIKSLKIFVEDENYYKLEDQDDLNKMIIQQNYFSEFLDFEKDLISKKRLIDRQYIQANKYFNLYDTQEIV